VKPEPLTEPALTVTEAVPDEVSVTDWEAFDATLTVPKLTLVALTVSVDTALPRLIAQLCVVPSTLAFNVTVCAVVTAETVAEKLALVAPAATVTEDGTATAAELLDRLTTWPPVGAAAFSFTVQLSVAALVSEALAQLRLLGIACPVPLREIFEVVPVEELLVRVNVPAVAPALLGSN
jgi:hypothetical protein